VHDTRVAAAYHTIKGFLDKMRYKATRQGLIAAALVKESGEALGGAPGALYLQLTPHGLEQVSAAETADDRESGDEL
jgi:hypothetical protein